MKILCTITCGSMFGRMRRGDVLDMPDHAALEYIRIGYAEPYEEPERVVPVVAVAPIEAPAKPKKARMKKPKADKVEQDAE